MKNLTKSDLINIEAFKQLIKCVSNDIRDVKASNTAPSEKANKIMQLYRQRIQLISQASEKYKHINWIDEAIGPDNGFNVEALAKGRNISTKVSSLHKCPMELQMIV